LLRRKKEIKDEISKLIYDAKGGCAEYVSSIGEEIEDLKREKRIIREDTKQMVFEVLEFWNKSNKKINKFF